LQSAIFKPYTQKSAGRSLLFASAVGLVLGVLFFGVWFAVKAILFFHYGGSFGGFGAGASADYYPPAWIGWFELALILVFAAIDLVVVYRCYRRFRHPRPPQP
jgi:hypothetical protein